MPSSTSLCPSSHLASHHSRFWRTSYTRVWTSHTHAPWIWYMEVHCDDTCSNAKMAPTLVCETQWYSECKNANFENVLCLSFITLSVLQRLCSICEECWRIHSIKCSLKNHAVLSFHHLSKPDLTLHYSCTGTQQSTSLENYSIHFASNYTASGVQVSRD